jgi:hypothetical protein
MAVAEREFFACFATRKCELALAATCGRCEAVVVTPGMEHAGVDPAVDLVLDYDLTGAGGGRDGYDQPDEREHYGPATKTPHYVAIGAGQASLEWRFVRSTPAFPR